jgi:peroxiredoxin
MGRVFIGGFDGKVVLIFGRYFGCPVCQLDFDELLMKSSEIKAKAEFVYFIQSSPESAREYIQAYDVDFPIVSVPREDGRYKLYDTYGVGKMGIGTTIEILKRAGTAKKMDKVHGAYEGIETQSPADFVVDESGKIIWAHRGLIDLEKLLGFLEGF